MGHADPPHKLVLPFSLDPVTPLSERVAAILALSQLPDLSVLGWRPSQNAELAALVAAAEPLLNQNLRHVAVVLEHGLRVSPMGLMHLARLSGLDQLDIAICADAWVGWAVQDMVRIQEEVMALLTALCRIRRVCVLTPDIACFSMWRDLQDWCVDHGLPLPAELDISIEAA